ncbi:MAG: YIP1 family protein [Caldilineales bacterium]|nr:YIP1 family protein [Caldilineales bacterium]
MTSDNTDPPASLLVILIEMIAAPAQALRRISAHHRRSWWLPALLAAALPALYLWLTRHLAAELAARQIALQLGAMPPEQAEAARPMIERFQTPEFIFLSGAGVLIIGLFLAWLVSSMLIYFGASLTGARMSMPQVWPAVVWAWLPFALRAGLQSLWAFLTDRMILYPGLSYLTASGDTVADQTRPLFTLAAQVDLFALWHLVLVFLIFRHIARSSRGAAFMLTLLYAAINLGLRLLPTLLGGAFGLG